MSRPIALEKVRKLAGWSRDRAAVEAKVSYLLARLYEIDPALVKDEPARARLDGVYSRIREIAEAKGEAA